MSELFGIQGRLDAGVHLHSDKNRIIVELKSGSVPYKAGPDAIKPNHSTQLLLYYLLIGGIKQGEKPYVNFQDLHKNIQCFLLYSKVDKDNLRLEQPNLARIQRVVELRNKIIKNEMILMNDDVENTMQLMQNIQPAHILSPKGIFTRFREII